MAGLGGADQLVNYTGVMVEPFTAELREDYRPVVEVNLVGAITITVVLLDQLRGGGGDIVAGHRSSVTGAGRAKQPGNRVDAATIWGITGGQSCSG